MPVAKKIAIEAAGWTGAVFSLSAYSLNSLDLIASQSAPYLLMNIVGCAFLIIYAVCKKAYASWVLNGIWLLMTAVALVKTYGVPW